MKRRLVQIRTVNDRGVEAIRANSLSRVAVKTAFRASLLVFILSIQACVPALSLREGTGSGDAKREERKYKNISRVDPETEFQVGQTWIGLASWYGEQFHGEETASGTIFDMESLSAAHRYLPFGTKVRVINLKNRKSCEVPITDRGPFMKGRMLDLSKAAAKKLGMLKGGPVEVQITILSLPD